MSNTDNPHRQDASKTDEAGQEAPRPLTEMKIGFLHPPGFEPAAFLVVAIDKNGNSFTNAPTDYPAVMLRLGTIGLDFVSQRAVLHMQAVDRAKSPILQVPAGMELPPFRGPAGRS